MEGHCPNIVIVSIFNLTPANSDPIHEASRLDFGEAHAMVIIVVFLVKERNYCLAQIVFLPGESWEFPVEYHTDLSSDLLQKLDKFSVRIAQVYSCKKLNCLGQCHNLGIEVYVPSFAKRQLKYG